MAAGNRSMSCQGVRIPMRERLAIHVELQQLPSFWAGDQARVASIGASYSKLGQSNLVFAAGLAVRGPQPSCKQRGRVPAR